MLAKRLTSKQVNRRDLLTAASLASASVLISACTTAPTPRGTESNLREIQPRPAMSAYGSYVSTYAAVVGEGYEIPSIPIDKDRSALPAPGRARPNGERPGTIVVDTSSHFLYQVREDGDALRYGVGLGRAGFEWSGRAIV